MKALKADLTKLKTIANYASMTGVTTSYIYKLIKENKIISTDVDGIKYIDIEKYPKLPN